MVQSEEITAPSVHINATNLRENILPYTAYDANEQRRRGQRRCSGR